MGKIIDVSEFQKKINWSKVKKDIDRAYIRLGYRGSLKSSPSKYKKINVDKYWEDNLKGVIENKIPFGVYYFPTAITTEEALDGAEWFYDQVKDLDMSMPPMLDSENVWGKNREAGRANSLSRSERTRLLKIVIDYFNERGMRCGIYASAYWLRDNVDMSKFPDSVCVWVADSTGDVDYYGDYWLHQYGKGYVSGIDGDVDLNRLHGDIPSVMLNDTKKTEKPKENPVDVFIGIADAEVGYHEGANNKNKYGDLLHSIQPRNMDAYAPWCDAFVDFCVLKTCQHFGYGAETARKVLCGDFDDYTYNSVALYKKASRWTQTAQRGAQIFFGGSGHTGIVYKVDGGRVYTIEGNKSDQVKKCDYAVGNGNIIGYGLPRFDLIGAVVEDTEEEYENMPLLKKGSQGRAVIVLQAYLGFTGEDLDGSFGNMTRNAVIQFQKKAFPNNSSEWDGEVGDKTWNKLIKSL